MYIHSKQKIPDQFFLYTTPNPAVVNPLQHYFSRLSVEFKEWRKVEIGQHKFNKYIREVHMSINRNGVMLLDIRNLDDERNIHRVPLRFVHPFNGL
jgi:hypothetical protein